MAQEGNGRGNAHHGFAYEGEGSKKSNGLGIEMHHMDLVVGKHGIEESRERRHGTQAKPSSFCTH